MIRIVHGPDDYLVDQELEAIKPQLSDGVDGEVAVEPADAAELDPQALLLLLAQPPFLWARRILVIRNAAKLADMELDLSKLASGRDPNTALVLVEYNSLPRGHALLRALSGVAEEIHRPPLKRRAELIAWITAHMRRLEAQFANGVPARLAELVGPDARRLDSEIRKLMLHMNDGAVDVAAVDRMVAPIAPISIFKLVDAVVAGRRDVALATLYDLLRAGEQDTAVLGLLSRQTRNIILAQYLLAKGEGAGVGEQLGVTHQFALEKLLNAARRMDPRRARRMHLLIHEADVDIKLGRQRSLAAVEALIAAAAA